MLSFGSESNTYYIESRIHTLLDSVDMDELSSEQRKVLKEITCVSFNYSQETSVTLMKHVDSLNPFGLFGN